AAGGRTHRANRRITLFAPGAGAPTRLRRLGSKPVAPYGGPWARRSRAAARAPALHLRCLRAYVGERVCPREGRAPARPQGSRRTRPWSQQVRWLFAPGAGAPTRLRRPGASLSRPVEACGLDVPGKRTPRGVAHLRYACVVCALTSASGCAPREGR